MLALPSDRQELDGKFASRKELYPPGLTAQAVTGVDVVELPGEISWMMSVVSPTATPYRVKGVL
jgi:hypothetical protein